MAVSPRMQGWLSPAAAERFVSRCTEPGCTTWTFGDTQHEANDRMTVHRGQRHTFPRDNAPAGERSCPS
jgi:hypothetical protein